ncbi:beta-glucosidase BglX [Fulvivirga sp. M361]|uniref:beta-glucosidase BglX n=1 Tax=Fulvivirga sp. M361 TaxID=2594266 RepID=UPI00117A6AB1|nr:beta-glucosidase BglX [Fulvivirga sp. M361]TRX62041.1 beta-glucosidase BglX [Fulvivirga sp. M361]
MTLNNKTTFVLFFVLIVLSTLAGCTSDRQEVVKPFKDQVDSLLAVMTLEEKIGQLNLVGRDGNLDSATRIGPDKAEAIRKGHIGSLIGVVGAGFNREVQRIAVEESRLGIPLLFARDVIHGYKTLTPVPLAEAASWDLGAIEKSARMAAFEASASGINWTYAPMVDVSRDPRWGRVMEGAGEDPYYGSLVAAARVRGFQGNDLNLNNTILACAKHFAGYGSPMAGREYSITDISMRELYEVHLPPFKAAFEAGVGTYMTSFTEINAIPATVSRFLLTGILRERWGFDGFVVTDWSTITQLMEHGVVADSASGAAVSLKAGVDMDMGSLAFVNYLKSQVDEKRVTEADIDTAVRRILLAKYRLGLFEDPYRYADPEREKREVLTSENRELARDIARKSMVLLKNEGQLLPLSKSLKTIAVIGPLADDKRAFMGRWKAEGNKGGVITLVRGIKNKLPDANVLFARGADFESDDRSGFQEALAVARQAEAVILAVGESQRHSGEASTRASIDIPGVQLELVQKIHALDKPVVVLLFNGRPLTINWLKDNIPAILEAWIPGTEGGNAIADVVFGDYNPSGKLPMTFPHSVGQIPVFYSYKNTGRPDDGSGSRWVSGYYDIPNEPLYPFGYGLSYTTFEYFDLQLGKPKIEMDDTIRVRMKIRNTGPVKGEEVIQLYIRDLLASVTRPVKELKGFKKVMLEPGESKTIKFQLSANDLMLLNEELKWITEPGEFQLMIGSSSSDIRLEGKFELFQ